MSTKAYPLKIPINLTLETPVSIRERVYIYIRNEILKGQIPSMTRLVEKWLANQIGTSRTPVREAFHILEKEGLLEAIPRVGYRVKPIKWEEVEEICEIRKVNETLAARWAMSRMTLEDFQALNENLIVSGTEVKEGHIESFVDRDAEFHEILARASGSQRLLELCQMLRRHMLRYRIEGLYLPEPALRAIEGHRRILDRLEARDEEGVKEAVYEHIEESKRAIQRYVFDEKIRKDASKIVDK